jgi:hypothetical protein
MDTHMKELGLQGTKAGFYIAQTLAISQLGKCHHSEMVGAAERLDFVVASVVLDNSVKSMPGEMVHQLRENRRACVHLGPPSDLKGLSVHSRSSTKQQCFPATSYL